MYSLKLYRDFYTNDATTCLTMSIIKDHCQELTMSDRQDYALAIFKNKKKLMECVFEITMITSNLLTGDISIECKP